MDGCRQTCMYVYMDGWIYAELYICAHIYAYIHTYRIYFLAICLSFKENTKVIIDVKKT